MESKLKPDAKFANNPLALAILREGLAIQDRFSAEPIYSKTGKGYLKSVGVEEIEAAKKLEKNLKMTVRKWIEAVSWEMVVWQNEQLCQSKHAHHGPTSDGHDVCKQLWSVNQDSEMTLYELVDFCRRCHRLAPFTNYNGNTFAAIVRALILELNLPATQSALGRSLAGHIVAGVAGEDELKAFEEFCKSLE